MAVPSLVGDVKVVSPISAFVQNTLTLKCFFYIYNDVEKQVLFGNQNSVTLKIVSRGDWL